MLGPHFSTWLLLAPPLHHPPVHWRSGFGGVPPFSFSQFPTSDSDDNSKKTLEILQSVLSAQTNEEDRAFRPPFTRQNVICYRGAYVKPVENDRRTFGGKMCKNTGLWGPNVYAGCRDARTGNLSCLKELTVSSSDFFECPRPAAKKKVAETMERGEL